MRFVRNDSGIQYLNDQGNVLGYVNIEWKENQAIIHKVFVDDSLRGQGMAGKLMTQAMDYIQEKNLEVVPVCSYAMSWLEKNKK